MLWEIEKIRDAYLKKKVTPTFCFLPVQLTRPFVMALDQAVVEYHVETHVQGVGDGVLRLGFVFVHPEDKVWIAQNFFFWRVHV